MKLSIFEAAAEVPDRIALVSGQEVLTYRSLAERVKVARPSAALVAEPTVAALIQFYALMASGTPAVLLHPRWTEEERERAVREAAPASKPLALVFTSGSTGQPKAVPLGLEAVLASAEASEANLGWREEDRWLLCLPFAHVGGLSVITRCLAARKTVVLATGSIPDAVERHRVTLLSVVPTQLAQLLHRSPAWEPPPFVRAMLVGGAATPSALLAEAADRGWPVLTTYGLTEACSQVATQRPGTVNRGEHGSGPPLPGVEVRIQDGAIQVKGRTVCAPVGPDGWFTTGDLGRLDEAGCLHVLGRRDDAIVTGGEKVLPHEVEEALRNCPGVADACVLGAPDPTWGQVVSALVVPRAVPPAADALARELGRLAPYKRPRQLAYAAALPLGPNGKVDRRAAAELCAATAQPFTAS